VWNEPTNVVRWHEEENMPVRASIMVRLSYPETIRRDASKSWPHSFEQIPIIFKWILRGQAASAEGRGSESKYTTSGVRVCRLEWGLRVL